MEADREDKGGNIGAESGPVSRETTSGSVSTSPPGQSQRGGIDGSRSMPFESREQLEHLLLQSTLGDEYERRRLAAEVQDYLAQLLAACHIHLQHATRLTQSKPTEDLLSQVDRIVAEGLRYTRSLIDTLSPNTLYRAGLHAALAALANEMKAHGFDVAIREEACSRPLSVAQRIIVFKAIRELLFNVYKHAGVDQAEVLLDYSDPERMTVQVRDAGSGFNVSAVMKEAEPASKSNLTMIQAWLGALSGTFDVRSTEGSGTQVILTFPLHTDSDTDAVVSSDTSGAPQRDSQPSQPGSTTRLHVVLADDHKLVRQGLRSIIEDQGEFEVIGEAADGQEVVRLARTLVPDVIVMDVNMPKLSGREATIRIRSENPGIQIVALSVNDDQETAESMLEAGAAAYLTKGGPIEALYEAIRSGRR